jgi:hypothetical protein
MRSEIRSEAESKWSRVKSKSREMMVGVNRSGGEIEAEQ